MTTVLFTTIVLFVLAIPGYVSRLFYYTGELDKAILPRRLTDELTLSFGYAILIHAFAVLGIVDGVLPHRNDYSPPVTWLPPEIDYKIIGRIITGEFSSTGHYTLDHIVENVTQKSRPWILAYAVLVVSLGIAGGWGARKIVLRYKLDQRIKLLEFENMWLYRHSGRGYWNDQDIAGDEIVMIRVEVLVRSDDENTIAVVYGGIWENFSTEPNGDLRELVIHGAEKRHIKKMADGVTSTYKQIPASSFIIKYSEVTNMKISYIAFKVREEGGKIVYDARLLVSEWGTKRNFY